MKLSAAQLPVAIGVATLLLGVPSTLAGEAALRDRGRICLRTAGWSTPNCEPASPPPSVPSSRTAAPTNAQPLCDGRFNDAKQLAFVDDRDRGTARGRCTKFRSLGHPRIALLREP
jgi:hypothetical protein